eukprot:9496887-Pyramimonas_sp.AAC.2
MCIRDSSGRGGLGGLGLAHQPRHQYYSHHQAQLRLRPQTEPFEPSDRMRIRIRTARMRPGADLRSKIQTQPR